MKKIDIIEALASKNEITKKAATEAVDSIIEIIKDGIKHEDEVDLFGFTRFTKEYRPARKVRNPKTNEYVDSPASYKVKAKFSPVFIKELLD